MPRIRIPLHATWECEYHVRVYAKVPQESAVRANSAAPRDRIPRLGAAQGMQLEEYADADHVILISIPPKYSVAEVMDF
jgi:hypothetical protein